MIEVFLEGHDYSYEVLDILSSYFDRETIQFVYEKDPADSRSLFIHSSMAFDAGDVVFKCVVRHGDANVTEEKRFSRAGGGEQEMRKQYKRMLKNNLLTALEAFTGKKMPWGILTGIRPVKVVHKLLDQGFSEEDIQDRLTGFYRLSVDKAKLCLEIAAVERKYILPYDDRKVSVYISIPFCPTRCSYCSFPSHEVGKWGHLADEYLNCLYEEMDSVYNKLAGAGYSIQTVYIGGGTPTVLNHAQLKDLLEQVNRCFVSGETKEFTVEAGRPDTLDREKLSMLKAAGVTRISINPQSMNSATLERIGRRHTPEEVVRAYDLARSTGHSNINMDIIIGLPGEDIDMVVKTLDAALTLKPEGLTVHTLAIKRASRLNEQGGDMGWVEEDEISGMVEAAAYYAGKMGMKPYYLYKQRYMVGNHENIGYSLPGYECLYNMQIMEEKQSIIGLGAGAVSKLVFLKEDRLERLENIKNVEYYISRFGHVMEKKLSGLAALIDG